MKYTLDTYKNFEVHFEMHGATATYHNPDGVYDTFSVWLKVGKKESREYTIPFLRENQDDGTRPANDVLAKELETFLLFLSAEATPAEASAYLKERSEEYFDLMKSRGERWDAPYVEGEELDLELLSSTSQGDLSRTEDEAEKEFFFGATPNTLTPLGW